MLFEGEENRRIGATDVDASESKLTAWLMRKGLVTSREQARWVALGIAAVFFIAAVVVFISTNRSGRGAVTVPVALPSIPGTLPQ